MNSKRVYYIMIGLISLLFIGLMAGAYGVNSLLQSRSNDLTNLKLKDQVLANQQVDLAKAKQDVAKYSPLNQIAQAIVPQDKDQAEAVLEITNLAKQSGIGRLDSITFPASTLGGSSTGTKPAPANAKVNSLTQLTRVAGVPGVYEMQITIAQTNDDAVPYDKFMTFLSKLEQNRRTAQVTSINVQPNSQNLNLVSFNLIVNVFIKP